MPKFSESSQSKLDTCHESLRELFSEVIKEFDCTILEGGRTPERQAQLVSEGKSKTMNSKHLEVPSLAVDVMPYPIDWYDKYRQHQLAVLVYKKAMELGIRVRWGGTFRGFYDGPHWELIEEEE